MSIVVTCQNCSQVFQVPDKLAGKTGKCTKCDALLAIPAGPARHGGPAIDSSQGGSKTGGQPAGVIEISCPKCAKTYQARATVLGKKTRCKACGHDFVVSRVDGEPEGTAAPPQIDNSKTIPEGLSSHARWKADVESRRKASDAFQESERVFEFDLMPGEQVVDELVIFHRVLFVFRSGVTKVTLTNARVLYNATRVFSPIYWIALALCPLLIWYYPLRIGKNRHVSLSLQNIDSIEKKYRANWLVLLSACLAGVLTSRMVMLLENSFGHWLLAAGEYLLAIQVLTNFIVFLVVGPLILLFLLKTRIVSMFVRSANNLVTVHFGVLDRGVSEERFDAFIQKVNHAKEDCRK